MNQNPIHEEIKSRLKSGNACYHLVQNIKIMTYRTINPPVVLYGCETWSLTLREEHSLRVFENRVLRKIFRLKGNEVTEDWRKLHNKELYAVYSSPSVIQVIKSRRMGWAGHVARMGEKETCTQGFGRET
jgi:hypothetical protein